MWAVAIAVDSLGNAYLAGYSDSDAYVSSIAEDGWISLTNPIENYAGGRDLYIQEIDPTGGTVLFSSFMGGSEDDYPGGMAIDTIGDIYLTGYTYSSDYPVTPSAFQTALAGQINMFVSKIAADSVPAVTLTAPSVQSPIASVGSASPSDTIVLRNMGSAPLTISRITTTGDFSETDNCGQGVGAANTCSVAVTFTPTQPGLRVGSMVIEDNAPGSPHVVNLAGLGTSGVAEITASALSFSPLTVGTSSTPQSITITNTGNAPLTIKSVQATGDFSQ
jgi:beta-propeller repeat-containing protein